MEDHLQLCNFLSSQRLYRNLTPNKNLNVNRINVALRPWTEKQLKFLFKMYFTHLFDEMQITDMQIQTHY